MSIEQEARLDEIIKLLERIAVALEDKNAPLTYYPPPDGTGDYDPDEFIVTCASSGGLTKEE